MWNVEQNGEGWGRKVKLFLAKQVWTGIYYTNKKSDSKDAFNWRAVTRSGIHTASMYSYSSKFGHQIHLLFLHNAQDLKLT